MLVFLITSYISPMTWNMTSFFVNFYSKMAFSADSLAGA